MTYLMQRGMILVVAAITVTGCGDDGNTASDANTTSDATVADATTGTADAAGPDASVGFVFRTDAPNTYVRVDRVGMPLVNTVLTTSKDAYNAANPTDDIALTFLSEIVASLAGLHAALDDDLTGLALSPCTVVGDGTGTCIQTAAPLILPDVLTINTTTESGFPNGYRLADPAIDIMLAVFLLDLSTHSPSVLVGLNPTANDVAFAAAFPYLAPAH